MHDQVVGVLLRVHDASEAAADPDVNGLLIRCRRAGPGGHAPIALDGVPDPGAAKPAAFSSWMDRRNRAEPTRSGVVGSSCEGLSTWWLGGTPGAMSCWCRRRSTVRSETPNASEISASEDPCAAS
jgi:hypothetical protein